MRDPINRNILRAWRVGAMLAAFWARTLAAQEVEPKFEYACTSGGSGCDGVCQFDWKPYYERLERLQDLQQGNDFDTVILGDFPSGDARTYSMKETYYTRKDPLAIEAAPLYRCTNPAIPDSRISASSTEGAPAYNCLDSQGVPIVPANPWLNAAIPNRTPLGGSTSALLPLRRYLKTGGTDYRTWTSQAPPGYTLATTYDGTSAPARLGYERFGNLLTRSQVVGPDGQAGYGSLFLQNGYMTVDFNRIWGNAIGRITQFGTNRQIVSESIGDMVQSVLRFGAGDLDCRIPNPTQSGGAQCVSPNYGVTARWAGSPVVTTSTSNPAVGPKTVTSVVRPLEFCHNGTNQLGPTGMTPPWSNATSTDPMAWNGFIERTDALTCLMGPQPQPRKDVLRTSTRIVLSANNGGAVSQAFAGLNTYWLKPRDLAVTRTNAEWDFDVWCEDFDDPALSRWLIRSAAGNAIVNGFDSTCGAPPGSNDFVSRHRHAIVVTRKDQTFGYAVARLSVQPGDTTNLTFRCALLPCNLQDKGVVIIQANHPFNGVTKTAWSAPNESFLIMNTKSAIMIRLSELKTEANAGGVNCSN